MLVSTRALRRRFLSGPAAWETIQLPGTTPPGVRTLSCPSPSLCLITTATRADTANLILVHFTAG